MKVSSWHGFEACAVISAEGAPMSAASPHVPPWRGGRLREPSQTLWLTGHLQCRWQYSSESMRASSGKVQSAHRTRTRRRIGNSSSSKRQRGLGVPPPRHPDVPLSPGLPTGWADSDSETEGGNAGGAAPLLQQPPHRPLHRSLCDQPDWSQDLDLGRPEFAPTFP